MLAAMKHWHIGIWHTLLDVLPSIDSVNLQGATIRLMNRMARFANACRDRQLMEIADDGIITEDERPLYTEILNELKGIIAAYYQLRYCAEDREEGRWWKVLDMS